MCGVRVVCALVSISPRNTRDLRNYWYPMNLVFIAFAVLCVPHWLDSGWALPLSASAALYALNQNTTGDADASGRGLADVRGWRGWVVPRAHARQPGPH